MSEKCFVIQPISNGMFTKRYDDVYKPAIENAGLSAYRVDLDLAVKVLIEEIESKIKDSVICFADISADNPNVWYELGYAFASGKDVVMVCDESRQNFPFDVQHKHIIRYKTESASDFDTLKRKITEKIKAYIQSPKKQTKILENPIKETDEFEPYELDLLRFIVGEQNIDEEMAMVYTLSKKMTNEGYNDTAFSLGLRSLKKKGFITTKIDCDSEGNEYPVCSLSADGDAFVLKNRNLFDTQKDDLPF